MKKIVMFSLVLSLMLLQGCGNSSSTNKKEESTNINNVENTKGSLYSGVKTLYTKEYRQNACNNQNIDFGSEERKQSIIDMQLCPFEAISEEPPKTLSVEEIDNKVIRSLDENFVWIEEEIPISENQDKVIHYIADINGNTVYDVSEENYELKTYDNDKLIEYKRFQHGLELAWKTYEYTTGESGKEIVIITSPKYNQKSSRVYKNGKLLEEVTENNSISGMFEDGLKQEWFYEDDEIVTSIYNYRDNGDLFNEGKTVENYKNNLIYRIDTDPVKKYFIYDSNGMVVQSSMKIDEYKDYMTIYSYDFQNGKCYSASYEIENGHYVLAGVSEKELCDLTFNDEFFLGSSSACYQGKAVF